MMRASNSSFSARYSWDRLSGDALSAAPVWLHLVVFVRELNLQSWLRRHERAPIRVPRPLCANIAESAPARAHGRWQGLVWGGVDADG